MDTKSPDRVVQIAHVEMKDDRFQIIRDFKDWQIEDGVLVVTRYDQNEKGRTALVCPAGGWRSLKVDESH